MIDAEKVQVLRRSIVRMAHSEEEVHLILQLLQETNWTRFYTRECPVTRCSRCSRYITPQVASCESDLCLECQTFICALCKQPTLKDDYYGYVCRVICESCLIRRDITVTWQSREFGRIRGQEIRAQQAKLIGDLPFRPWLATLEHFNWQCAYCCEEPYTTIEHFIPISQMGDTIPSNCVPACRPCNYAKSTKHPNDVIGIHWEDIERVKVYLNTCL